CPFVKGVCPHVPDLAKRSSQEFAPGNPVFVIIDVLRGKIYPLRPDCIRGSTGERGGVSWRAGLRERPEGGSSRRSRDRARPSYSRRCRCAYTAAMNTPQDTPSPGLVRALGPWMAVAVVVGTVIGSGVFKKPQAVAASVPYTGLAAMAWVL